MTVPFRKDEADDRDLTTAGLAGAKNTVDVSRNEVEAGRLKPVRSERSAGDFPANQQRGIPAAPDPTPLFPDDQLQDLQARWSDIHRATRCSRTRRQSGCFDHAATC